MRTIDAASKAAENVTARELGARIVQAVETHAGNHPQFDDIALVCFGRVTEQHGSREAKSGPP